MLDEDEAVKTHDCKYICTVYNTSGNAPHNPNTRSHMSLNLNHVTLAGNLTRDPELRQIGADKVVANTGLAINRRWKDPATGETREEATFVDIEAWGRTAELMGQYLKKGSPAYIEGRLKLDTWEDKKDGSKRSKLRVIADSVQFLGGRDAFGESDGAAPARSAASNTPMRPSAAAHINASPLDNRAGVTLAGETATNSGDREDEPPF